MPQATAIDGLHGADVGGAVVGNRDVAIVAHRAGHTHGPQQFLVGNLLAGELVHVDEKLQHFPGVALRRRHELEQRFGIVGGDPGVGQRRAQGLRVRRARNAPVSLDAQAFALEPHAIAGQQLRIGSQRQ